MKELSIMVKFDFESMLGSELIQLISWKNDYSMEAESAFIFFCSRYENDLLQKAEIYCSKFNYSEVEALLVVQCTFARVWKYPTFDLEKAKSKNIDKAILMWMYPIMYTQIILLGEKNTCSEPEPEDELNLIYSIDELIEFYVGDEMEKKKELKLNLEVIEHALLGLSLKHKIIFLTYKAYESSGKNIPRSVGKKLRDKLELTQNSIGVYKMDAKLHIANYLKQINGCK